MEDNLQRFVSNNRSAFDDREPSADLWNRIEADILPITVRQKAPVYKMLLKAAAAAIVVFLAGTGVYYLVKKEKAAQPPGTETASRSGGTDAGLDTNGIASLAPGYAGQVYQFAGLIQTKQRELRSLTAGDTGLCNQFDRDFYQLDSCYLALKQQLPGSPDREALLQALIYNLELQLEVLTQQLDRIQEINHKKNNNGHENINNKTI